MIYDRECLCPIGKKIQPPSLPHIPRQELATNQHRPSDGKEQEHLADVARLVYLLAPLSLSLLLRSHPLRHPTRPLASFIYDLSPSHRLFSRLMKILYSLEFFFNLTLCV